MDHEVRSGEKERERVKKQRGGEKERESERVSGGERGVENERGKSREEREGESKIICSLYTITSFLYNNN